MRKQRAYCSIDCFVSQDKDKTKQRKYYTIHSVSKNLLGLILLRAMASILNGGSRGFTSAFSLAFPNFRINSDKYLNC